MNFWAEVAGIDVIGYLNRLLEQVAPAKGWENNTRRELNMVIKEQQIVVESYHYNKNIK